MKRKFLQAFLLMVVVGFLGGCAKPEPTRVLWPPLPDTPRLEWLGVYYSEADLPRSRGGQLVQGAMGRAGTETFGRPFGVAANGNGLIYVSDIDHRVVRVVDMNRGRISRFAEGRRFQSPLGLALDSSGNLYIAEGTTRKVLVFSATQEPLFAFGDTDLFKKPAFVAINERLGRIYVSDGAAHRIVVFDMSGKHLFSFGEWGNVDGAFYSPQGMAIDGEGRVFVADQFNARIQVFDADGGFLFKFGTRGAGRSQFEFPKDLAFDSDGNLHIIDVRKAALVTYTPEGRLLLFTGGNATASPVGFSMPMAISIDSKDGIFIVDGLNRRLAHWRYLSDEYLAANPLDAATIQQQKELMNKIDGF